ncbi:MAG: hypothetical protein EOM50_14970 [Erysipelotrichia bacterium]|nr:hypothetical protein [Erysipelotrichia bacterium]
MAKLDKLKIEADVLKGYLFFILGFMVMVLTGLGTQIINFTKGENSGLAIASIFVLLILLQLSGIIFVKIKDKIKIILREIEKE